VITIIHPSRGRPEQAFKTAMMWIDRIGLPDTEFEYILSLDSDDMELWNYPRHLPILNFTVFRQPNKSAIEAINFAAKWYSDHRKLPEDFLIVISDDFECPEGWGLKLIAHRSAGDDWIMKTQDGIQDWLITLPIMSWKYFNRFGYVYHPSYLHAWSDSEMTCVAELTGRLIFRTIAFKHNHYTVGGLKDAISERADAHFEQGRKNFEDRAFKFFDLTEEQMTGKMSPNIYSTIAYSQFAKAKVR